jgi:predicted DNA binding protein
MTTKKTVLTDGKVRQLRKAYASGKRSQRELAERFGIGKSTVSDIVRGVTRANA